MKTCTGIDSIFRPPAASYRHWEDDTPCTVVQIKLFEHSCLACLATFRKLGFQNPVHPLPVRHCEDGALFFATRRLYLHSFVLSQKKMICIIIKFNNPRFNRSADSVGPTDFWARKIKKNVVWRSIGRLGRTALTWVSRNPRRLS